MCYARGYIINLEKLCKNILHLNMHRDKSGENFCKIYENLTELMRLFPTDMSGFETERHITKFIH